MTDPNETTVQRSRRVRDDPATNWSLIVALVLGVISVIVTACGVVWGLAAVIGEAKVEMIEQSMEDRANTNEKMTIQWQTWRGEQKDLEEIVQEIETTQVEQAGVINVIKTQMKGIESDLNEVKENSKSTANSLIEIVDHLENGGE